MQENIHYYEAELWVSFFLGHPIVNIYSVFISLDKTREERNVNVTEIVFSSAWTKIERITMPLMGDT